MLQPSSKIFKDTQKLSSFIELKRKDGAIIVTTNGCFDIIHRGHIEYLFAARKLGDFLIVGLNSDSSVRKLKGPKRPVTAENDRALVLAALECIDAVYIFAEDTPERFIEVVRPDIHVKGGDYKINDLPEKAVVEKGGGKIKIIPFVKGYSTTEIIGKLNN